MILSLSFSQTGYRVCISRRAILLFSSKDRLPYKQLISVLGIIISLAFVSANSKMLSMRVNSVLSISPLLWLSFTNTRISSSVCAEEDTSDVSIPNGLSNKLAIPFRNQIIGLIIFRKKIRGVAIHIVTISALRIATDLG